MTEAVKETTLHTADGMLKPLPHGASNQEKKEQYDAVLRRLQLLLEGEDYHGHTFEDSLVPA